MKFDSPNLGELIEWLESKPADARVRYGFGDDWYSDRGDYSDLAFAPRSDARIGDMLKLAKSAVGQEMEGYKGGIYSISLTTDVCIGQWGRIGEAITPTVFRYWEDDVSHWEDKHEDR